MSPLILDPSTKAHMDVATTCLVKQKLTRHLGFTLRVIVPIELSDSLVKPGSLQGDSVSPIVAPVLCRLSRPVLKVCD